MSQAVRLHGNGDVAGAVLEVLARATQPVTIRGLAWEIGVDTRHVQAAIQHIRTIGAAPVCSGAEGYWLAGSVSEYEANVSGRRRRALTQLVTVRGERALLRRLAAPPASERQAALSLWGEEAAL